ncbi:cysteine--tRNA ligase [Oxynema sp. CENA135]|uniref:cysteine--tRNA ligase n=1 Tax=Oxynema sp. CENA135 TaxID=984206 RepID=UPI00190E2ABF|nr:cysteine--tRNA ligase [Oxynema sp. CENA135]MBK4729845.1 cysteine--tRNA ligase [Oxynema sp. CENA135]
MTLKLYNSLTRRQEPFEPVESGKVRMYCCGVTVYDYCHLGHARSYIAWDTVRRYLIWRGFDVRYVQNFTDIDDKILNRAREQGTSMEEVADRYTQAYFEDMDRLNILRADDYPRATHTLNGIERLISELEQKGYAYPAGGDVYYAVRKFPEYGQLSGRRLEEMQAGASGRVAEDDPDRNKKKDPFDFALWKAAKPGEPAWDSPWGKGRPGWHIECSAMVREKLGETIDIHMGGADLVFPHHENEIAQSQAATGHPLAKYWMHNGFVTVNGEKMSKSLGNFTTIRELLDRPTDPMAVRLFVLQAQYRKPIDFTEEAIATAEKGWATLKEGLSFGFQFGARLGWETSEVPPASQLDAGAIARFEQAMDEDFNSPGAIAVLFELAKELRRQGNLLVHEGEIQGDSQQVQKQWQTLVSLAGVLGLKVDADAELSPTPSDGLSDEAIAALLERRQAARQAKDFAEADRIRDELQAQGIVTIDRPGGVTQWHRS